MTPAAPRPVYRLCKRALDVAAATAALLVLSPVMLAVAVLVRATLGRPVLFRHSRPGRGARPFVMLKFRTMRAGTAGAAQRDGDRLTRLGRWLRSTSLDELPELVNVLRGEMSLVGPRPLLVEYLPLYTPAQARRHEVLPGMTGWAQVNGRNAVSWEDKLAMDTWYVDHGSFALDTTILWRTLRLVFARHGISAPGEATAAKFTGQAS